MLFRAVLFVICICLSGCAPYALPMPDDFVYMPIHTSEYDIATWQKMSDNTHPIRIYIEGDGHAFDANGNPTRDPTPQGNTVRRMAMRDNAPNVVYIARPCQYIMSDTCSVTDWTSGRFSSRIVNAMSDVVRHIAGKRPIILIGYSGGAMLSGLIISKNPNINVSQWITVAGVLNHTDWTNYFGDSPLSDSVDVNELPRIPQCHFVAARDNVVPRNLSVRWTNNNVIVVPDSVHNKFGDFIPNCPR